MSDEKARAISAYEQALTLLMIRSREPDQELENAAKQNWYDAWLDVERLELSDTPEYFDAVLRAQSKANEHLRTLRRGEKN